MPRSNYGHAVKLRATQFFSVLIDYANDQLDIDEIHLANLQREIQLHWQTEKRCVVRTKVRYLENLSRLTGMILTGENIKESIKCLTDFLGVIEDNRATKGGSETWHFTLNLWHDRFDRSANLKRFDHEWDLRRSTNNLSRNLTKDSISGDLSTTTIDYWFDLVRSSLSAQQYQRITTNQLMMGKDRLKFSLEEIYVPIALIEHQHVRGSDRQELIDNESEEVSSQETSEIIPDADRLLAKLIPNLVPNRIAIIGEPGSGKTTCLQRIAAGLLATSTTNSPPEKLLPIWISLADLQGETLENYLLQDWLKNATQSVIITPQLHQDFVAQFKSGKVWLLLDAVDEMAMPQRGGSANDPSIALANLEREFRGWIGAAHIILTCRSNVWNSGKNALENFTTYHNQSLSNGYDGSTNRVKQFIQGWFRDRPNLGETLINDLTQPQFQRLRDAIRNPLRLALLCCYRSLNQGSLPSTKASLYHQFTDAIYEWKQDRFPTSLAQRKQLDQALSKLALQAINLNLPNAKLGDRGYFRLEQYQILELVNPDLLELALQLGWLSQAGISASTGGKIYAFCHATFQEYFAARSIIDWRDFFVGSTIAHRPILSYYWRETILFWFGRGDVGIKDKEDCLNALINFDCDPQSDQLYRNGGFYYYRAYFLAAGAIAEFPESIYCKSIIDQLLKWRFAEFRSDHNTWQFYPAPIQNGARLALRQTDQLAAIVGLEKYIENNSNPFLCWQAAYSLGKVFDPGNPQAISTLIRAINTVSNSDLCIKICESLMRIDPSSHQVAIDALAHIIKSRKTVPSTRKAAFVLGKLLIIQTIRIADYDSLFSLAIDALVEIISGSIDSPTESKSRHADQLAALDNLRQICPTHSAIQGQPIVNRTLPSSNRQRRKKVAHHREIGLAIAELEQKLAAPNNAESQRRYAYQLGKFQPGHPLAIRVLLQLISSSQSPSFYKRTGEYLQEIILDQQIPLVIRTLRSQIIEVDRSVQSLECYKLIWYCAEQIPDQQFSQFWQE
jgi:Effector-associated domain 4/NACHT domain